MKSGDIVIKEAIGIGDNEVDALNDAKKQLGLDENAEVDFEIIQRAEKKNLLVCNRWRNRKDGTDSQQCVFQE